MSGVVRGVNVGLREPTLAGLASVRGQWVASGCDRDAPKPGGAGTGGAGASQVTPARKILKQALPKVKSESSTVRVCYKSLHIILRPKLESMVFLGGMI